MNKPNDILEFLRRQAEPDPPQEAPKDASRPEENSDLTLRLTRRQQAIAGAVAVLALFLAGLIGAAVGGSGPDSAAAAASPAKVWVIRAVSYKDNETNRVRAREVAQWLERRGLGQATLRRLPKQGLLVVVLGAWLENPVEDLAAQKLVQRVQNLDWNGEKPFHGAFLWQISVR